MPRNASTIAAGTRQQQKIATKPQRLIAESDPGLPGVFAVEKLQADNPLCRENPGLRSEIEQLRGQLSEARCLDPYNSAADVLQALTVQLPGWPAARWAMLCRLIEQRTTSWSRTV